MSYRKKVEESYAKCPIHKISYPARLGCPRCRSG